MFLLENGSKLSLITQEFIRSQPSFTVTHDTQIFMSMSLTKISNSTCQKITAAEEMNCVIDKAHKIILESNISCVPIHLYNIFNVLERFPLCKNDVESARLALLVFKMTVDSKLYI